MSKAYEDNSAYTINESEQVSIYQQESDDSSPPDRFYLVYFIMLLQGAGTLFPWNSFISAPDYFNTLYGQSTLLYLATAYSIPNLLGLLVMIWVSSKIPLGFRVIPAYIVSFAVLVAIPVLGFCHVYGTTGFVITLVMCVFTALCTALLQGGIFGFAGFLPPIYIQAVMSGNGLAGITTSFIRVLTKVTLETKTPITLATLNLSAAIYFFVSAGVIVLCIVSYFIMSQTPFVKAQLARQKQMQEATNGISDETARLFDGADGSLAAPVHSKPTAFSVFKKIYHMCFLITFTFFISLAIFPGISVVIETHYPNTAMAEWLPILMIVIFNVFDFIGRTAPRFVVLFGEKSVTIPILIRVVFLPLFILCIFPRVIVHDAFPLIFMAILALSNGYLSSIVMMTTPGLVEPQERELCGTMMTFFLLMGICLGSNCGLLIGKIVGV